MYNMYTVYYSLSASSQILWLLLFVVYTYVFVNVEYTNITHILGKINRKYIATIHVITAKPKASAQSSLFTPIHDNITFWSTSTATATAS